MISKGLVHQIQTLVVGIQISSSGGTGFISHDLSLGWSSHCLNSETPCLLIITSCLHSCCFPCWSGLHLFPNDNCLPWHRAACHQPCEDHCGSLTPQKHLNQPLVSRNGTQKILLTLDNPSAFECP